MNTLKSMVIAALIAIGGTQLQADDLVLNGNFGTGDLTDWTVNTGANFPWQVGQAADGKGISPFGSDTYFVATACVGSDCITGLPTEQASLSQTLSDLATATYTLTFEFGTGGNGAPDELNVLWNGTSVLDLGPGGTLGVVPDYQLYTVTGLVGTGSDTITFLGRQDPEWNALADISVSTSSSPSPEPATPILLGMGLVLIGLAAGKRKVLSF